ncbi:hypothetical protein C2845_PM10G10240 [Panicum miliaceum]|uniref:Uncharacterized protein n=1 Tax=Panicum miliaceum TaxID=4540 RepID=A0A3L6PI90_PANMI|nr:hypothetical protein C2845_PM10G10240 [Panicum miliaceum]
MTLPARSPGFGVDEEAPLEEAKLSEERVPRRFIELGKVLTTHHLPFQVPDIDPYLRYALEAYVAKLMSELGDVVGGTSGAEASAQAVTSAQAGGPSEELDYFDVGEFNKGLGAYRTESLGSITTSLSLKALLASRAVAHSAKRDGEARLNNSSENLRLTMANQRLKEEIKTLEDLRILLNDRVEGLTKQVRQQESAIHKMQKTIDQKDGILEKLHSTVEKDVVKIKSLEVENKGLKEEGSKKDQLIEKLLKEAEDNRCLWMRPLERLLKKVTRSILSMRRLWRPSELNPSPYLKILRVELRVYLIGS